MVYPNQVKSLCRLLLYCLLFWYPYLNTILHNELSLDMITHVFHLTSVHIYTYGLRCPCYLEYVELSVFLFHHIPHTLSLNIELADWQSLSSFRSVTDSITLWLRLKKTEKFNSSVSLYKKYRKFIFTLSRFSFNMI